MATLRQMPGGRLHPRFGVTAATAVLVLFPAACGDAPTPPRAAPSPSAAAPRASVSRAVSPSGSTQRPLGGAPATGSPGTIGVAPAPTAAATPDPYAGRRAPAGSVLARLPRSPRGPVTAAGVRPLLAPLLHAPQLGPRVGVLVVDPYTGAVPYSAGGTTPLSPASTLKLLTATAVLDRYGAAHRFRTRVLLAPPTPAGRARVVLVGGGDPSLTSLSREPAEPGELGEPGEPAVPAPVNPLAVANPTRLPGLAAATARALRARGLTRVAVAVDDTLFTGPKVNPAWPRNDVPDGFVSPVDALSMDNGRVRPRSGARSPDPARAAGQLFAHLLGQAGIAVTGGVTHATAPVAAPVLAAVDSPPLAALLRRMLQASDNDYAEDLFRQPWRPQVEADDGGDGDRARDDDAAEDRLDDAAMALARCGCHR